MDFMGYKRLWNEDGEIPSSRINVESHIWDKTEGEHFFDDCKHKNAICRKIRNVKGLEESLVDSRFAVKPVGDTLGHMMVRDNTATSATLTEDLYPIMPNYVRDLAGRVICIAECFPTQKESSKSKRFPNGSFCIDENFEGSELIENVFFANFRTLDISPVAMSDVSGQGDEEFIFTYNKANLHPYKLRTDTFYQDGWKLPQTEMLYFRKSADGSITEAAINDFMGKWDESINHDNYEAFYEECGGEEYFEDLFNKGVTLIPTLEGYNANAIVDKDFNLVDYHAGKYVAEFHELVDYVDSDQPAGTIVSVIQPGFLTHNQLRKAMVIVSNGVNYVSPNHTDPDPLFPDLRLPHSRTSSKWGDVHIPTHPKHFENPAIWGWDFKTGMFLQEKGPIWDPLHYYYHSHEIISYYYQDKSIEGNGWLYAVPADMKTKFYPVIPFSGFDILDNHEKEDRLEYGARPYTLCKRYDESIFTANIGYHPMPVEFEYEIDPWVAPDLAPMQRVLTDVPLNIRDRLAEVIQCNVPAKLYLARQNEHSEGNPYWFNEPTSVENSTGDFRKDYPYLDRYLDHLTSVVRVKELSKMFLGENYDIDLDMLMSEYISGIKVPPAIDDHLRDMTVAYYDLKEKSFNRLKNRHRLYRYHNSEYVMNVWNCADSDDLTYMLKGESVAKLEESKFSSVAIMQPPTF